MTHPPNVPPKGEHSSRPNHNSLNFTQRPQHTFTNNNNSNNNNNSPAEVRPLPPPHHHHHHQQRIILPGPNDNNRMLQPGRPSNGVTSSVSPAQQSPYHRSSANLNRSKSLTRPERQRPRAGMINNSNPNAQMHGARHPGSLRRNHPPIPPSDNHRHSVNQPMSSNLQLQLAQQKQQHQMINEPVKSISEEQVKEANVLNNWWAWIAFLVTCCFPNYIIRHCFGKPNNNIQQAWRQKLIITQQKKKKKKKKKSMKKTVLNNMHI
jgi:chitin synthase